MPVTLNNQYVAIKNVGIFPLPRLYICTGSLNFSKKNPPLFLEIAQKFEIWLLVLYITVLYRTILRVYDGKPDWENLFWDEVSSKEHKNSSARGNACDNVF